MYSDGVCGGWRFTISNCFIILQVLKQHKEKRKYISEETVWQMAKELASAL